MYFAWGTDVHPGVEKVDCGRENSKFPPHGKVYDPLLLSVYGMEKGCEYDGLYSIIRLHCMVQV